MITQTATPTIAVPFCIAILEGAQEGIVDRGYGTYPSDWSYDPATQVSDLILMGDTSPTTYSRTASTGIINSDPDESEDDTGKD